MNIKIQIKTVYGVDKVYPACPTSAIFARMIGTKTLSDSALRDIAALGYNIEIETPRFLRAA